MKALKMFIFMSLFCGGIFPLVITAVGKILFPDQTAGSLLKNKDGQVVGSALLGQPFQSSRYFWGRPTVADQLSGISGASNLSLTDQRLREQVKQRAESWARVHGQVDQGLLSLPPEMLSASASGLDPHISPQGAVLQIERVIVARRLRDGQKELLLDLIEEHTEGPTLHLFGESRVNVLKLNLALDEKF